MTSATEKTPSREPIGDSTTSSKATKYSLIATLYVAQAIPLGFFITAMPIILRSEGLPIEQVGLFSVIAFPWLIKFLWAPIVDRFRPRLFDRLGRPGHYLSWILPLQALAIVTVLALSGLDLASHLPWVVTLAALFMLLSATQDIATDGLSVRALSDDERGPGNGLQVGGYYLGQVLGGGLMLLVFADLGWAAVFFAIAALLALPIPWALRFREPTGDIPAGERVGYAALRRFFTRPGTAAWVLLLLLFRSGEAMATFSFNQLLLDLGLNLENIGYLSGMLYAVGALAGSLLGGWLVPKLGRRVALLSFGALQCGAILAYSLVWSDPTGSGQSSFILIAAAVFLVSFAGGAATAALYTSMMDASEEASAGTDFTIQQSLCAVGPVIGIGLSGFTVTALGYPGHFVLCALVALVALGLAFLQRLPDERRRGWSAL